MTIYKTFEASRKGDDIIVNTASFDRERDRVFPKGAVLDNYLRNPVLLWGHNYHAPEYVIGVAEDIRRTDEAIIITPNLREPANDSDPMNVIRLLWEQGIIRTASIGFMPLSEPKKNEEGGWDFEEWELLEISLVPVPANQDALRLAAKALEPGVMSMSWSGDSVSNLALSASPGVLTWDENGLTIRGGQATPFPQSDDLAAQVADRILRIMFPVWVRGVIPYRRYPLADPNAAWDGPAERRRADVDDLRVMCAWYDSDAPDVKASYKLPHHRASDHYVVWNGVRAAMAALLGARGGADIPAEDRRGVYNHLARHYRDFDKEPPEFREYAPEELRALFPDDFDEEFVNRQAIHRLEARLSQLLTTLTEVTR